MLKFNDLKFVLIQCTFRLVIFYSNLGPPLIGWCRDNIHRLVPHPPTISHDINLLMEVDRIRQSGTQRKVLDGEVLKI